MEGVLYCFFDVLFLLRFDSNSLHFVIWMCLVAQSKTLVSFYGAPSRIPIFALPGSFVDPIAPDQMRPHIRRVAVAEEQGTRDGKSVGSRIFREPKPGASFDYEHI